MASDSLPFSVSASRAAGLRPRSRAGFLCALLISLCAAPPASGQTGIMVTPTRITLGPEQRSGEIFVLNRGGEPITARISLVNRHMREDGSFVPAVEPDPGERFADRLLQYAPRRVHLGAGQGQTVRVRARLPPNALPAEYRSHLMFRVEPPAPGAPEVREAGQGKNPELGIRLMPVYGITIPVIVRTGPLSAAMSIDEIGLRVEGGKAIASFKLHRTGNRSIYGDVRVLLTSTDGSEHPVGRSVGLAVYAPLPMRFVSVPLPSLQGDALPKGRLRVQFVDHGDGARVLAEAERILP